MLIRVLIINRQLVFAVTIKQALEQTGAFEVHPFTDPQAAMEYLRTNPHDVALIDFTITVMLGAEIVERLRMIQPDIAIIVSPVQPDSSNVIRDLRLQGMVDAPFSARGIIPVIEHAVEQMSAPSAAITRSFVDAEDSGGADTEILGNVRVEPIPDREPAEPAHTHILPEQESGPPGVPLDTRILEDETSLYEPTDDPGEVERADTRLLSETRNLEAPSDAPPFEPIDTRVLSEPPPDTRILNDEQAEPPSLPEFSTLGNVLDDEAPTSLYQEPPVKRDDTPSVPDVDSDAVRQYLATSDVPSDFESMLGEISPEDDQSLPQLPAASREFDDLVNSMKASQEHKPLPDRHQQFVEFILTGGMDGLLSEIEKSKTEPLDGEVPKPETLPEQPKQPSKMISTFEKLAAEEPPMPSLEDSGTIGDLMIGVSDTSFRNVLAMMRDEEPEETTGQEAPVSRQEIEAAYAAFFEEQVAAPAYEAFDDSVEDDSAPDFPEPTVPPPTTLPEGGEDTSIPAQLILKTTEDDSTPVDSFSINNLLGTIEKQLHDHKPDIQPLPSWQETPRRRRRRKKPIEIQRLSPPPHLPSETAERFIKEPDFLPEEFSPAPDQPAARQGVFNGTGDLSEEELAELGKDLFAEMEMLRSQRQTAAPDEAQWIDDDEQATVIGQEPVVDESVEESSPVAEIEWDDLATQWDAEPTWDEPDEVPEPPESLPGFDDDWALTVDDAADEATVMMERPSDMDEPVAFGAIADFEPEAPALEMMADTDDPFIAQIALSLTQVSLELAAEATLLTNEEEIVAIAGQLAPEEIEELRSSIADDWDPEP